MANALETNNGRKVWLYRANTANGSLSSTQYLPPTKLRVGVDGVAAAVTNTTLNKTIPVEDGTVLDDGSNNLTGSSGGDNSTDNTTTYKPGAGETDATAQNLIANDTNVSKIWSLTPGTVADETHYTGLWVYIKDATAYAKFLSSGTALEVKLGSDASNYYSKTYTKANLATGWNWLSLGVLEDLTETGTVAGSIDTFSITITTNNATDEFVAGDIIYDLLRQWELTDAETALLSGYPTINFTTLISDHSFLLNSLEANGFLIDNIAMFNEDTTPLMTTEVLFGDGSSKSDTDEFRYTIKRRAI